MAEWLAWLLGMGRGAAEGPCHSVGTSVRACVQPHADVRRFDYAVVGAGCIGAAAARHLVSQCGGNGQPSPSVLILGLPECRVDDLSPPWTEPPPPSRRAYAEHYDEGRITRCTSADALLARVAQDSIVRYRDVEAASGVPFFIQAGALTVGDESSTTIRKIMEMSKNHTPGTSHPMLVDHDGVNRLFPFLYLDPAYSGVYEATEAGYLSPRQQVKAHLTMATRGGATVVQEQVQEVRLVAMKTAAANGGGQVVRITTESGGVYHAGSVLIAAGGFTNFGSLLPEELKLQMVLTTHTTVLGEVSEEDALGPLATMPAMVFTRSDFEYGLPPIRYTDGKWYVKFGHGAHLGRVLHDEESVLEWYRNATGDPKVAAFLRRSLEELMPNTTFLSWKSRACVISKTTTGYPFLGKLNSQIAVAVGGNGYAAKGADEWGRMAATLLVTGQADSKLSPEDVALLRPRLRMEPLPSP